MVEVGEEPLSDLVARVVEDAKEVARAEVGLVKAQAAEKLAGYRSAAILFAVASVLGLAALPALMVGLILTLSPMLGSGWSTLLVIGAMLLLAGLLGWLGMQRVRKE